MSLPLSAMRFTRELLEQVADFDCGDEPWSSAAADWIKLSPPFSCALKSMSQHGTEVWAYFAGDMFIGFGSLGAIKWPWPLPDGPTKEVGYIPQLAIAKEFQGQPDGPKTGRYAWQIMGDLLARAVAQGFREVCLLVDSENARAQHFYEQIGFTTAPGRTRRGIRDFIRMFMDLPDDRQLPG